MSAKYMSNILNGLIIAKPDMPLEVLTAVVGFNCRSEHHHIPERQG